MTFTGKERAALRAEAHHLTPLVHVGQQGITPALRQSAKEVLRTKELVKMQVGKTGDLKAKEAANELAAALEAEVIQVIGRTFTLYKHNPRIVKRTKQPWQ